jgi:hypothetical protein
MKMKRFSSFFLSVLVSCILITSSHQRAYGASDISCSEAKAWVKAQVTLPTTLKEFSQLPIALRRQAFSQLSDSVRTSLWIEHLNSFRSDLNPTQLVALEHIIALITLQSKVKVGSLEEMSPEQLAATFNSTAHPYLSLQMFTVLGSWDDDLSISYRKLGDIYVPAFNPAGGPPGKKASCGCSTESDHCGLACNGGDCTGSSIGCGTLWEYACNGTCA